MAGTTTHFPSPKFLSVAVFAISLTRVAMPDVLVKNGINEVAILRSPSPVLFLVDELVETSGVSKRIVQARLPIGFSKRKVVVLKEPFLVSKYSLNKIIVSLK